jgi:hypothetical protein
LWRYDRTILALLLGLLEHLKIADTGFGEALGAELFVFEPVVIESLRDAGESASRALFPAQRATARQWTKLQSTLPTPSCQCRFCPTVAR